MSLYTVSGLDSYYGDFRALFDVTVNIGAGEAVALIGANGAGKTTLMRTICGMNDHSADQCRFKGVDVSDKPAERLSEMGISMVPEGRRLFQAMTVRENLQVGADLGRSGHWTMDTVFDLFPNIAGFAERYAGLLSGGQQQMVAIGRALMTNPELLLFDEVSLGLAPAVVDELYDDLKRIMNESKMSVLFVEQDIGRALSCSDRFYCLLSGRVSLAGKSAAVTFKQVSHAYFGDDQ